MKHFFLSCLLALATTLAFAQASASITSIDVDPSNPDSVRITWHSTGAVSFEYAYVDDNLNLDPWNSRTRSTTIDSAAVLTGLDFSTYYAFALRPQAADGSWGEWSQAYFRPGQAGASCSLTLVLYDSYGDGWNGGFITIAGSSYTLEEGKEETFTFTTAGFCEIEITIPGSYPEECSFAIFNDMGDELFSCTSFKKGVVFNGNLCSICPKPNESNLFYNTRRDALGVYASFQYPGYDSIRLAVFDGPATDAQVAAKLASCPGDSLFFPYKALAAAFVYVQPFCGATPVDPVLYPVDLYSPTLTFADLLAAIRPVSVSSFPYSAAVGTEAAPQFLVGSYVKPVRFTITEDSALITPAFFRNDTLSESSFLLYPYQADTIDPSSISFIDGQKMLPKGSYLLLALSRHYGSDLLFYLNKDNAFSFDTIACQSRTFEPLPLGASVFFDESTNRPVLISGYAFTPADSMIYSAFFSYDTNFPTSPLILFSEGDSVINFSPTDVVGYLLPGKTYTLRILRYTADSTSFYIQMASCGKKLPVQDLNPNGHYRFSYTGSEAYELGHMGIACSNKVYRVIVPEGRLCHVAGTTTEQQSFYAGFFRDSLCLNQFGGMGFYPGINYAESVADTFYLAFGNEYNRAGDIDLYLSFEAAFEDFPALAKPVAVQDTTSLSLGIASPFCTYYNNMPSCMQLSSVALREDYDYLIDVFGDDVVGLNGNLAVDVWGQDSTLIWRRYLNPSDTPSGTHYFGSFAPDTTGTFFVVYYLYTDNATDVLLSSVIREYISVEQLLSSAPVAALPASLCGQHEYLVEANDDYDFGGALPASAIARKVAVPAGDTLYLQAIGEGLTDVIISAYLAQPDTFLYFNLFDSEYYELESGYVPNRSDTLQNYVIVVWGYDYTTALQSSCLRMSLSTADFTSYYAYGRLSESALTVIGDDESDVLDALLNVGIYAIDDLGAKIADLANEAEGWCIDMEAGVATYCVVNMDLPLGYEFVDGRNYLPLTFVLTDLNDLRGDSESTSLDVLPSRAQKFFHNGNIYIQTPDGRIYTTTGLLVK